MLPTNRPEFPSRFGTDAQCREYLLRARQPYVIHCAKCGHGRAWAYKGRLIAKFVFRCDRRTARSTSHHLAGVIEHTNRTQPASHRIITAQPHPA